MPKRATAAAPLHHVGLVALEALLVAVLVWIAAMTLAGATGAGGVVGLADAGPASVSLAAGETHGGRSLTVTADPGDPGMWVHLSCTQAGTVVLGQWAAIGADHAASFSLDRSPGWAAGAATCTAEEGYFSANGRWRVVATTTVTTSG
jgi:hypothetical protein